MLGLLSRPSYCQWRWIRGVLRMQDLRAGVRVLKSSSQADVDRHYEEAVHTLNCLQSNAATLQRMRQDRGTLPTTNLFSTERFLKRVGVSLDDVDKLNVIHIAGTKGKGSTCAFIESILREHGYRTGFYSSPHLVAVRERIRINGQPISKEDFTKHFWDVYTTLTAEKENQEDMPAYFKFLTVLALKVFMREEVDVAVLEVGLGGEYDCTNVVRKPVVCGVTTLDFDHTSVLGKTIESIAWHKAGIMKPGVPTFILDQQSRPAMSVLIERAKEKDCPLYVVPPLESYGWGAQPLQLGLAGSVQYCNASLALQLSQCWINSQSKGSNVDTRCAAIPSPNHEGLKVTSPFTLSSEELCGLRSAVWPGRSQVMSCGPFTYFIDGAHTITSMQACVNWFQKTAPHHTPPGAKVYRVLIFNTTGDRDPESFLQLLAPCNFDLAVFTTNLVTTSMSTSSDQMNFTISLDEMHLRCDRQRTAWIRLVREFRNSRQTEDICQEESVEMQSTSENQQSSKSPTYSEDEDNLKLAASLPATDVPSIIFACVQDALLWLSCGRDPNLRGEILTPPAFPPPEHLQEATQVQILVTGSLHLVGSVLGVIDPSLSCAQHIRTANSKHPSLTDLVLSNYAKFSSPGAP